VWKRLNKEIKVLAAEWTLSNAPRCGARPRRFRQKNVAARVDWPLGHPLIRPEELVGEEWAEWYRLTRVQRWLESEKLWQTCLALGGSLDPEPDSQSPFFDARAPRAGPAHGRAGQRVLRRGRV